jgi:phosphotransferase system  glucose/maltose/N-acetylglucosamine-specific IIC component
MGVFMTTTVAWLLFGALIGISAAQRRGFGVASGIIGGLMLGPFAVLMYLVSGGNRKCQSCQKWVDKKASICPYCRSGL